MSIAPGRGELQHHDANSLKKATRRELGNRGGVKPEYLPELSQAASFMLHRASIAEIIRSLEAELLTTSEPFVWASLGLRAHDDTMPSEIQSAWIFALKAETWSGAHYHPNSTQHMIVIRGQGRSRIAGSEHELTTFDPNAPSDDQWSVTEPGVPHEFYPLAEDMIVMSFHTAKPAELLEVSAVSDVARHYGAS